MIGNIWIKRSGLLVLILLIAGSFGCISRHDLQFARVEAEADFANVYVMKERFLTLNDQFVIKDREGHPLFKVEGELISIGDKLSLLDMEGQELAFIDEQVINLTHTYRIYRNRGRHSVMKELITLIDDRYVVIPPEGPEYEIRGNFFTREYGFYREGRMVAMVTKKQFTWNDTYSIGVVAGEDDVLILSAAVVMDMVAKKRESHRNRHH